MYNSNTNPIYAFVPGGYKAGFIPPVIGNELDRLTFARTTVGSRRKKDGLLEQMSVAVPRLNYDYKKARELFQQKHIRTYYVWESTEKEDVKGLLCLMKTINTKF